MKHSSIFSPPRTRTRTHVRHLHRHMFSCPHPATDATVTTTKSMVAYHRVAGITIYDDDTFENVAKQLAVLWRVVDKCAIPAEQRTCARLRLGNGHTPAALINVSVWFIDTERANAPILGPLTTAYPTLVRSLQVLEIRCNDFDESAALRAFAALATNLGELIFYHCGLTSVQGLERGHCKYLQKVDLTDCKNLKSLEGLADHVYLKEVDATATAITSVEPLRSCPALTTVCLYECPQLSSIEALEHHQWLEEVILTRTPLLTSIEGLRTCPALKRVYCSFCPQLTSIDALEGHQYLEEINATATAITSVEPLRTCPRLVTVYLIGCHLLPADAIMELPDGAVLVQ